jgi:Phosphate-selective porin O and P
MKKSLITLAIVAAVAAPLTASADGAKFFGYSQITAQSDSNSDLKFGADRIRLGYKIKQGKAWGKLQLDAMKSDNATNVGVDELIKDAVVGYKVSNAANVSAGIFKTPVGMDFNTSGKKLDITKRGMEKKLVLERAAGLMISGRKMDGFGYDVGVFNPAQRSSAVNFGTAGDGMAFAGRVMYDMGKTMHLEASYGSSAQDSGAANKDYTVFDIAGKYKTGGMTFKAEYIAGSNVKGIDNADETVWYVHAGMKVNKGMEAVVRHYAATQDLPAGGSQDLANTYLGLNIFLANKNNARIQLNYVLASGDKATYSGVSKGYTDDTLLAQFQVGF